ncbi:MAG: EamA family transporter [Chitinophagaceae bacterium]|nr:EamA family transporter [Chitinophagaceae bacterium]
MNKRTIAHLALIFANIFFAINLSAVKHLTNQELVKPFGLNLVRVVVSVLLFWGLYVIKPVNIKIEKKDRLRLLFCAITGIAINQLFFLKGLSYLSHSCRIAVTHNPDPDRFYCSLAFKRKNRCYKSCRVNIGPVGCNGFDFGQRQFRECN